MMKISHAGLKWHEVKKLWQNYYYHFLAKLYLSAGDYKSQLYKSHMLKLKSIPLRFVPYNSIDLQTLHYFIKTDPAEPFVSV